MEKLPVLNLDYVFDLLWDIKDTDQLKNAWNGCHCTNVSITDEDFLELVAQFDLQAYLDEADTEHEGKRVPAKRIFDVYRHQDIWIEKARRYDVIVAAYNDEDFDPDYICSVIECEAAKPF